MTPPDNRTITLAIVAGCGVAFLSFGLSAPFGVFLTPVSEDLQWEREVFSLSIAVQLLFWGLTQPLAGAIADRRGSAGVIAFGGLAAAAGFALRAVAETPAAFVAGGALVGVGTGAAAFPIVVIALGKVVSAERRSFVMGLGTAAASLGMVCGAPFMAFLIETGHWRAGVWTIAGLYLAILPAAMLIARVSRASAPDGPSGFGAAISAAFGDRSYLLLFAGFFVCGFHVAFIQTHLPSYIADSGLAAGAAGWSLALIGLLNIAGSFGSGWLGQHRSKKLSLSAIYFLRAAVIALFVLAPVSEFGVYLFSAAMGILWLSTVPLTMGLVAQTQGVAYLSTLVGMIFLSHQAGSFLGAWSGGLAHDVLGGYDPVWWTAVALGIFAGLIHLPIRERAPVAA